jgi:hypothetical protein
MKLYWVSMIIQDTENSKPWVNAISEGYSSIEEAKEVIKRAKTKYRVLSAWIETHTNCVKKTIFHEHYINSVGNRSI